MLCFVVPACERDRSERVVPRAEGRVVDEPFADLYVTAGPTAEDARLFALDLLNLELDRIAEQPVAGIVGDCDGRPMVRVVVDGKLRLMQLRGQSLVRAPRQIQRRATCRDSRTQRHIPGWTSHQTSPDGERVFLTDGHRVAIARGDDIEVLGRTELRIWSAVWARR